jgi:malonyl-CoA O-methyltransferase
VIEPEPALAAATGQALSAPWWSARRWQGGKARFDATPEDGVDLLWANMSLHMAADPEALISHWHKLVATDGFLMFSCLGPDTVRELRALHARLGWPAAGHEFTDMHDWGDMLVHAGFAEPVMDMERIVLTWATPEAALAELRTLGRNLHPARFAALRGKAWHQALKKALPELAPAEDGGGGKRAHRADLRSHLRACLQAGTARVAGGRKRGVAARDALDAATGSSGRLTSGGSESGKTPVAASRFLPTSSDP